MGADKRPARTSKARAMERVSVSLQEQSDDPDSPQASHRRPQRRSSRAARRTVTIESDDDFDSHPHSRSPPPSDDDPDHPDPKAFVQYTAPADLHPPSSDDSVPDHHEDPDEQPLDAVQAYLTAPSGPAPAAGVVTKYGRHVRPRQFSPVITPPTRSRRAAPVLDLPTSREARVERARRRSTKSAAEFQYRPEVQSVPVRTRLRQARPSYSLQEDDEFEDPDDDNEVLLEGNDDSAPTPMQVRSSRVIRDREPKVETRNGHRRVSTRRRSSANQIDNDQLNYDGKESSLGNGIGRATRRSTRQVKYMTNVKGSGAEEDDGDFPSPGTGEESEDHEIQDAALPEDQDLQDSDLDHLPRRSRRASSRRNRKTQPQRTVRPKVKRSKDKRGDREENPVARDARKSYRPRSESLRPSDYYAEAESSSEDSTSGGEFAIAARARPKRAAASRAGDAIANKVDFLQNPMHVDGSIPKRPRTGRYERRKGRLRPAGKDPFPSDDDGLGAAGAVGIEPIQVDLDLSWEDVGGLDHHVRALKEMVALPLLYPEVFEKFKMEAPKGVLFYGPPGTGKTLCARALAASCGAEPDPVPEPEVLPANTASKAAPNPRDGPGDVEIVRPGMPVMLGSTPEKQFAEMPASSEKTVGDDILKQEPQTDVIMTEAACEASKVVIATQDASSAMEKEKNAAEDIAAEEAVGFGPEALAAEHEAVVTERGAGLKRKIAARQEGTVSASKAEGSTSKRPEDPLGDKSRVKKKPRVSFFMRNGADCLSKWVGEAERQLRMTFEAAKKHQPSIIFFDEIDGLAPVRSSRQDQIHSSIVSTLLGLMDGLDARGKIVVIGATNRVDAIDPALRRPGRFDRELIFTLPNVRARRKILGIHTAKWSPPPNPDVLDAVASMTVGYCGADLKALCTESAIRALRRRYPQIYASREKLVINVDEVNVKTRDFLAAMKEIVPASHRSARTHARPITSRLGQILNAPLESCVAVLKRIFPQGIESDSKEKSSTPGPEKKIASQGKDNQVDGRDEHADSDSFFSCSDDDDYDVPDLSKAQDGISNAGMMRPGAGNGALDSNQILRPRLLICGMQGLGQAQLGPAILHHFEGCPVHPIDYASLHSDAGSRCAEEALVLAFREAMRSVPAILYLPHLDLWWNSASPSLQTTLIIALKDLPSDLPLLVLATADTPLNEMPTEVTELFNETVELSAPPEESRKRMFSPLLDEAQAIPRFSHAAAKHLRKKRKLEVLPKAPPPKPKPPTEADKVQNEQAEDKYLRWMRIEMRSFTENLLRDRRFKAFWYPVDPKSAPDYYDIIKEPMDIAKIAAQNDLGRYPTVFGMVQDFDILVRNAIQYNPPNTETGAAILRRAHGLIDIVHAWVDNLNPTLVETCNKIIQDRVIAQQKVASAAAASEANVMENAQEEGETETQPSAEKTAIELATDASRNGSGSSKAVDSGESGPHISMNGGPDQEVMNAVPGRSPDSQARSVEDEEIPMESATVASRSDVMALGKLLLDVTTGVTVDGLENLYVKCVKVLRGQRRNMNRDAVVKQLTRTATEARDDPAVVGTLVE